jgi:hypothetical protein
MMDDDLIHRIAGAAIQTVVYEIDMMIDETLKRGRKFPRPLMGGAHQAPFDGEEVGKFIRFTILMEVRDRFSGDTHTEQEVLNLYKTASSNE